MSEQCEDDFERRNQWLESTEGRLALNLASKGQWSHALGIAFLAGENARLSEEDRKLDVAIGETDADSGRERYVAVRKRLEDSTACMSDLDIYGKCPHCQASWDGGEIPALSDDAKAISAMAARIALLTDALRIIGRRTDGEIRKIAADALEADERGDGEVGMTRRQPDETEDYPGLVVCDDRVSGSITAGSSRLPLWCLTQAVMDGWKNVAADYGDTHGLDEEGLATFLHHLLDGSRGDFARLLCALADAERRADEQREEHTDYFCWIDDPMARQRIRRLLNKCLEQLDRAQEASE